MHKLFSQYGKKIALVGAGLVPMTALATQVVALDTKAAHPPHYPFVWEGWFGGYDTAALRRGYQVYKEVCSSCHPMRFLCYRHLVGLVFTESQAKEEAKGAMIEDGPNEDGDLILRPGVLTDVVPPPYKNDMAARAANNGALPPDLSVIVGARHGFAPYIFSLLTGFGHEVPPGQVLEKGQHFNPFFTGGAISMAPPLNDGAVEYPDGTPATITQMSADVTEFLTWSYWRNLERQKQIATFFALHGIWTAFFLAWIKKFAWAHWQTQRITYKIGRH